jgi:predicted nucleic-acid-binding Zn-ribbon protein
MRDSHICPKCRHDHVLLIASIPDTGDDESVIRPLHVMGYVSKPAGFIAPPELEFAGRLTAAVCKRCGYTELYALHPEKIPVDGKHVREVVGKPAEPYR